MDKVELVVQGGNGGNGVVSFRHEKFVPLGGPDGGNGGAGGNVYIAADRSITTLDYFKRKRQFKAISGRHGEGQKKHGASGDDLVIGIPLGTVISVKGGEQEILLTDISQEGQKVLVARGGKGGLGNACFATSRNRAPRIATKGKPGEERCLILELKIIADVGIIGYPNVGKSTLLAAMSKAKPKIADYPFTTREPVLGVVEVGMKTFVLAEIPGLIGGAHQGKGLGHEFLRHAERTKVLVHLLDGSSPSPMDDVNNLNTELLLYKPSLAQKPQVVVVNKVDLPQVQARIPDIKQLFSSLGINIFFISAITKQGVPELVSAIAKRLAEIQQELVVSEVPIAVFRPNPKVKRRK